MQGRRSFLHRPLVRKISSRNYNKDKYRSHSFHIAVFLFPPSRTSSSSSSNLLDNAPVSHLNIILPPSRTSSSSSSNLFGTHWCHQCSATITPRADGTCPGCGGGFIEEQSQVMAENPAIRLVSALQAVTELSNSLGGPERSVTVNRGGGQRQEVRINELLRELQTHIRRRIRV